MSFRSFSTSIIRQFESKSYYAAKLVKPAAVNTGATTKIVATPAHQLKWNPTDGNSFRSFAEYRLKVSNQSPLAVRSGNYISVSSVDLVDKIKSLADNFLPL
ncbi:uncharacterized protein RJT21DRAFT_3214 [Scheffersomyces amazonensis]|uniref:uncharacterized protein n=1 Tax=Scheffersomyces amazonensis TaxID=1078765 RepID=UPI00315E023E